MLITGIIWEHSWDQHWEREGRRIGQEKFTCDTLVKLPKEDLHSFWNSGAETSFRIVSH